MAKKSLKISIDEDVLKIAKDEIPNISKFLEEMFIQYFDYKNKELHKLKAEKSRLEEESSQNKLQIAMINEAIYTNENKQADFNHNQNRVWTKLIGFVINGIAIDDRMMHEGVEVLGLQDVDELNCILNVIDENYESLDKFKVRDDWTYAQSEYERLII